MRLEIEDPASANAQWCLKRYFAELSERFENGFNRAAVLPAEPTELRPPAFRSGNLGDYGGNMDYTPPAASFKWDEKCSAGTLNYA